MLSPEIALDDQNLRAFLKGKGWLSDEQYFLVDRRSIAVSYTHLRAHET